MSDLLFDVDGHIAVITLNSPATLNALTDEMISSWVDALERARRDRQVRAVVVTGTGRGFCSGMNVKRAAAGEQPLSAVERYPHLRESVHRVARGVRELDKPYIAAVNGAAAGAGMDMASMADIRFAGQSARFAMSYVRVGLIPGDGGCYYLPRIVGIARALDLMWTGRLFDANEALQIGYVTRVVADSDLVSETLAYAHQLASGPAISISQIRRLTYESQDATLERALGMAESAMFLVQQTEDAREGPRAFAERREPQFQGR